MAKKKKRKSVSILEEVDKRLNGTYDSLMDEIQDMQLQLYNADMKAMKKAKKKGKQNPKEYNFEKLRKAAREEVINQIEGNNFLDRAMKALENLAPIVVVFARLLASLILAILSFTAVKVNIKPATLEKLNLVYKKAMAIQ